MQRMADIVEARQGRVLRFTGDGVKAAFGMDEVRDLVREDAPHLVAHSLVIAAPMGLIEADLQLDQVRQRSAVDGEPAPSRLLRAVAEEDHRLERERRAGAARIETEDGRQQRLHGGA